jgi:predicted metal-binding membrane protein
MGTLFAGLVVWTSGTALLVAGGAWLYDRLVLVGPRLRTSSRILAVTHR